jgi:hypothetical protein
MFGAAYFSDVKKVNHGLPLGMPKQRELYLYSVEITCGINSVISKLMIFAENAETGQFLFLIMLIFTRFNSQ